MSSITRIFVALIALLLAGCSSPRPRAEPAPDQPHVRVMSYNVNYGLAGDASTIEAIRAGRADVVLLQETTPAWEAVLRAELGGEYAYMGFRHCCGAGGLAVLSKHPVESARPYLLRRAIRAARCASVAGWTFRPSPRHRHLRTALNR